MTLPLKINNWIARAIFVTRMYIAQFSSTERVNMLWELYFMVSVKPPINDFNMFELVIDTFDKYGYENNDFHHFVYITKLNHFAGQFQFSYFDDMPHYMKRVIILKAIKACIDHHQHKLPLPKYDDFIREHIGFAHLKSVQNDNGRV